MKPKPTPQFNKNFAPVPRNQVDRVNAVVGQLLLFKVPQDTFYDPEDGTELKLSLLSIERSKLDARHWLQFDSKNQEFYGVPKYADVGQKEYLLVAEDREGLTAHDALVVVVSTPPKKDYSAVFEFTLGIPHEKLFRVPLQPTTTVEEHRPFHINMFFPSSTLFSIRAMLRNFLWVNRWRSIPSSRCIH